MNSQPCTRIMAVIVLTTALGAARPALSQITFQAPFRPEASAGLFVGVREFVDHDGKAQANVTPVKYAVDDAVDLAHLFVYDLKLIAAKRAVLALSGEPQKPASRQRLEQLRADGADIRKAYFTTLYGLINEVRSRVEPEGMLVASFATHGFGDAGGLLYAADTDPASREKTSIRISDLRDSFKEARTPRRIVLLDACRELTTDGNARSAGVSVSRVFADAMRSAAGTAMIMGTTSGGLSYDDDQRQNGVFTASFIEALRSNVGLTDDGLVTLGEVYKYTHERVRDWVVANKSVAAGSAGISRDGDEGAFEIPLRADPATQQRIANERSRLFGVLQRDRDPAFIPDGLLEDVKEKLSTLTVERAKPLMISLQVFAGAAGRESAGARSKAFLEWWQKQAPTGAFAKAQDPSRPATPQQGLQNYQAQIDSMTRSLAGGAAPGANARDKSFARNFESWFVCDAMLCWLNSVQRFADRVSEIRFGEKREALNRTINMKALAALPPLQAYTLPIRQGTRTLYAQLQFADGSLSEVRMVAVTVRDQNASGLELKAVEAPRGVTAPVAFVNYVAGVQDVSVTLDAPIGTEVLLHAFDDGGFFESNGTHSVFAITAPANTQAVRVAFRMSDGKEIGPFRYVLKSVEAAVSATTTSALAAILAEAVVCTRVTFDWPPPANLDFGARQGYNKLGIDLMNAGLAKLARAPAVACRADRIKGMQYWGTVKELQFGTSPGQLTVQIKPSAGWLATLPATATGAYVKAVFLDGKSSREVRLRIDELNARQ